MFILLMSDVWIKFTTAFTTTAIGYYTASKYKLPCLIIRPQVKIIYMCKCNFFAKYGIYQTPTLLFLIPE